MEITIKLFANLRDGREKEMIKKVSEGTSPEDIAKALGIPVGDVAIVMINGRRVEIDTLIKDGDIVALFPPVGGG